ncbi:hypothetical protein KEM52_005387 [Ascosphaera acerosa]|nr:hypothetical protein KEM52_005387 [Ascosphaera acerosa]
MASLAVPPVQLDAAGQEESQAEKLDARISALRAEIRSLTSRRQYLTSALLSSPALRSSLKAARSDEPSDRRQEQVRQRLQKQVDRHTKHVESNLHRMVFSVTSFPYSDPSATQQSNAGTAGARLLGVRFDIPRWDGGYEKPFYIFLRKVHAGGGSQDESHQPLLAVYRHTIPAFVPLKEYERRYLPSPSTCIGRDEGEEALRLQKAQDVPQSPQSLHAFVKAVRKALNAWHVRVSAVNRVQHRLKLAPGRAGLLSVTATSLDHRYLRLEWRDGRVGRVRLGEQGQLVRAVVIGEHGSRDKRAEAALLRGGDARIDSLSPADAQ